MAILTKTQLIEQGAYYTPSSGVVTVPANSSIDLYYQGYDGSRYGLNRIMAYGAQSNINIAAKIDKGTHSPTLFSDINAAVLRKLFDFRSLRGAIIIEEQTRLKVTLTNTAASDANPVCVEVIGYDSVQLENQILRYREHGIPFPKPVLLYASATIPANAVDYIVPVIIPAQRLRLYRMGAVSSNSFQTSLKIRVDRTYIKPEVLLDQFNLEFQNKDMILPVDIDSTKPFQVYVSNYSASDVTMSFIAETYEI